ncbi:hypothetical protein AMECASPLE_036163 [Ameca splendens]|uniref:Uncharacterized protein n=1 Tax=Ameca splendens TaxID=208324 RepID=A0ABV0Y7W8_9TELE
MSLGWPENGLLLEELEEVSGERDVSAESAAPATRSRVPSEFTLPPPAPHALPPRDQWQNVSGVNILTHLYSEPVKPKPALNNYKIITNPRSVFAVSVHGVLKSRRSCAWVDRKMARMYHVKPRGKPVLEPQQLIYDGRMLSYSACLTSAVNTVLRETGLLPADGVK